MDRYTHEADALHREQQAYLAKVRAGRAVRRVDPYQPAFSPESEMVRQGQAMGATKAAMVEALLRARGAAK